MTLSGALQVGRSTLVASQAALQVAGNNMANAATEGFHRRSVHLTPLSGELAGRTQFIGRGVSLSSVRREVDTALQARLRGAIGEQHAAQMDQRFLSAIETLQNELTDNDLSSILSDFFNAFSELANNPEDNAVRTLVIQQGRTLAGHIQNLQTDYNSVREEIDRALGVSVLKVNDLLDRVADLNRQIALTEGGGAGQANALRDQRDLLVDEIAQYVDVTVIDQANGTNNILIGSTPVLLSARSRGIELRRETMGTTIEATIRVAEDGTLLNVGTGEIGGLMRQRDETVAPVINELEQFTGQLIFQVNRVHAAGQGRAGLQQASGDYSVLDVLVNLNSAANDLPYRVENGSFQLHVTEKNTGVRQSVQINIDGDSMSLTDLVAQINASTLNPSVVASIGTSQELVLNAASGFEFSFSDDSSGALAALGINSFFHGKNATDISVNAALVSDPGLLAAGGGHVAGSNDNALAMAGLMDQAVGDLNGATLREFWRNSVNSLAVKADASNLAVESSLLVRESISAQVQAISGVSLDEEAINMLTYQRQFQAGARLISVIDEMLQTLLNIV